MSDAPAEYESAFLAGLFQEPRRLAECRGMPPESLTVPECRTVYKIVVDHHRAAADLGHLRYATVQAARRGAERRFAGAPKGMEKDALRRRAALKNAVTKLLDEIEDRPRLTDHEFRDALDLTREHARDEAARTGLIEIVDKFTGGGKTARGVQAALQALALRISPAAALDGHATLHTDAMNAWAAYRRAKLDPGGGRILTGHPRLDAVTGGGKRGRLWMATAYAKGGKAGSLHTKILTPRGWTTMGETYVGQVVVNPEGGTARIVGVYPQGMKPAYRVTFSDGATTECCDEHLWRVTTAQRRARGLPWRTMTLREIMGHGNRYFVPMPKGIDLAPPPGVDDARPLDPYLLGALLGNGYFGKTLVGFSSADPETVNRLREVLPWGDDLVRVSEYDHRFRWKKASGLAMKKYGPNRVSLALYGFGLIGARSETKFVPKAYLWAPADVRLAVLQGLLDTDGHATEGGGVDYMTVSPQLAEDVCFLARSLGGLVRTKTKQPTFTYKGQKKNGQLAYRLCISMPQDAPPFRLARKLGRWIDRPRVKTRLHPVRVPSRGIVSVEYLGMKEMRCIALDSENHLYVTDDFIVTHNTQHAKDLIYNAMLTGHGCAVVTMEQTRDDVRTMLAVRHSHKFKPGGVSLSRVMDGTLPAADERAYAAACKDLRDGAYGRCSYWQAPGGTTVQEIRTWLDYVSLRHPIDAVMIDHTMLFEPSRRVDGEVAKLTAVIQECKQLALDFNGSRGAWVIACHQIKREGFEKAMQRGFYVPSDMAGAAEAERSCDVMVWLLRTEELQAMAEIRIGVGIDRWGPGEPKGWEAAEMFAQAAIMPIEDP